MTNIATQYACTRRILPFPAMIPLLVWHYNISQICSILFLFKILLKHEPVYLIPTINIYVDQNHLNPNPNGTVFVACKKVNNYFDSLVRLYKLKFVFLKERKKEKWQFRSREHKHFYK